MSIRKKRSTRARLGSQGRPPVAGRAEQKLFWRGIAAGLNSENAALKAGLSEAVGPRLFRKAGGMPPAMFRSSAKPLSGRYLLGFTTQVQHLLGCCGDGTMLWPAQP